MPGKTPTTLNDNISNSKYLSGEYSPQDVRQPILDLLASSLLRRDTVRRTLSGDITLSVDDEMVQFVDPDGAARAIDLPAEEDGTVFIIGNAASAANALTVNDDTGSSLETVNQDGIGVFWSDGTGWLAFTVSGTVT